MPSVSSYGLARRFHCPLMCGLNICRQINSNNACLKKLNYLSIDDGLVNTSPREAYVSPAKRLVNIASMTL